MDIVLMVYCVYSNVKNVYTYDLRFLYIVILQLVTIGKFTITLLILTV